MLAPTRLTDTAIRNARPAEKPRKLYDGDGLYLLLSPTGHRVWRFKYRLAGKEKHLRFGRYPEISLKMARDMRLEARRALELGNDPGLKHEEERLAHSATFEAVANEWMEIQRPKLAPKTHECKLERFRAFVFPYIGQRPIATLKALDILAVLRRIEENGRHETAHRVRSECGNVFRYGVVTGRCERDPTPDLRGAIAAVVRRNRSAASTMGLSALSR